MHENPLSCRLHSIRVFIDLCLHSTGLRSFSKGPQRLTLKAMVIRITFQSQNLFYWDAGIEPGPFVSQVGVLIQL